MAPQVVVGTEADAWRALHNGMRLECDGGNRRVCRDLDADVVYKVEKLAGFHPNVEEHENATRLAHLMWVPPTTLYRLREGVVLAMPFYPVKLKESSEAADAVDGLQLYLGDLGADNFRKDLAGRVWCIDLATRAA